MVASKKHAFSIENEDEVSNNHTVLIPSEPIERERSEKMKAEKSPIQTVMSWIRRQPPKVKAFLCVVTAMTILVFLRVIVHEHDNLFIASEAVHAVGISVLIYKLTKEKTCAGIIQTF